MSQNAGARVSVRRSGFLVGQQTGTQALIRALRTNTTLTAVSLAVGLGTIAWGVYEIGRAARTTRKVVRRVGEVATGAAVGAAALGLADELRRRRGG